MRQANECLINFFRAIGLFDTKNINCGKGQESGKFDSLQVTHWKAISSYDYVRHARILKVRITCLVVWLLNSQDLKNLSRERLKPDHSTLILRKTGNIPS